MPALNNPRHEAFAQALARGISVRDANVEAGLSVRHFSRAMELAKAKDIAKRAREIRDEIPWGEALHLKVVYDELMRLARVAGKQDTAPGPVYRAGRDPPSPHATRPLQGRVAGLRAKGLRW